MHEQGHVQQNVQEQRIEALLYVHFYTYLLFRVRLWQRKGLERSPLGAYHLTAYDQQHGFMKHTRVLRTCVFECQCHCVHISMDAKTSSIHL